MHISDRFLRGLERLSDRLMAAGSQNHLLLVDLYRKKVIDKIKISSREDDSVFDIKMLPSNFNEMPARLEA